MSTKKENNKLFNLDSEGRLSSRKPISQEKLKTEQELAYFILGSMGEIGFSIALPIAGGALLGSYLDRITGLYPRLTLSLLFFGVLMSFVGLIQSVRSVIRRSDKKRNNNITKK